MAAPVITEVDRQIGGGVERRVTYKIVTDGVTSAHSDVVHLERVKRVEVVKNDGSRLLFTPNETHASNPKLVCTGEQTTWNMGTLISTSQTAYFTFVFGPDLPAIK